LGSRWAKQHALMETSPYLRATGAMFKFIPMVLGIQCLLPLAQCSVCLEEPEPHQVSLMQTARRVIPGTSVGPAALIVNSYRQSSTAHADTLTHAHTPARHLSSLPPILFAKVHKTGGSSMSNIIHRMGDQRNLTFMLPPDNVHLGYPQPFPGGHGTSEFGMPHHQYDVICSEAILNTSSMYAYLKPRPHLIIMLREPTDHMISARHYFFPGLSWDDYLWRLSNKKDFNSLERAPADHQNLQGFDLGWYDFVGGTTDFDSDQAKINEWLATLDNEVDSVMLTEYFNEGLVLWGQKMQVGLDELTSVPFKVNDTRFARSSKPKTYPTEAQYQRLANLSNVDRALYAHFNRSFWHEWFNGTVSKLEADVVRLKRLNEKLQRACDEGDGEGCPPSITMDDVPYTSYLKAKQSAQ